MGSGSPDTSSLRLAQKPPTEPEMRNLEKRGPGPRQGGQGLQRPVGLSGETWQGIRDTDRLAAVPRTLACPGILPTSSA